MSIMQITIDTYFSKMTVERDWYASYSIVGKSLHHGLKLLEFLDGDAAKDTMALPIGSSRGCFLFTYEPIMGRYLAAPGPQDSDKFDSSNFFTSMIKIVQLFTQLYALGKMIMLAYL